MFYELLFWLFMVKEIVSKKGVVHFRRFRIIETPWFNLYLHKIYESDNEKHLHDHPFSFTSLVLKGSYKELYAIGPQWGLAKERIFRSFQINKHAHDDVHKIVFVSIKMNF